MLAAAPPFPRRARRGVIVRGAGFGHGVGMSQYGAYGFAKPGKRPRASSSATTTPARSSAKLGGDDRGARAAAKRRARSPSAARRASPAGAGWTRRRPTAPRARSAARRAALGRRARPRHLRGAAAHHRRARGRAACAARAPTACTDGRYRGDLELRPAALGVAAINVVSLEDYVRGVVAGEMPPSWPDEALRAQAVAARTYAIATSKDGDGFDQYADTRSQMYPGIAGEVASTDAAVAATARQGRRLRGQADRDVLLLDLRRAHGGRRELVPRRRAQAVPEIRRRSLRRCVAAPSLDAAHVARHGEPAPRRRSSRASCARSACCGAGARRASCARRSSAAPARRTSPARSCARSLGLYDTWARFTVITSRVVAQRRQRARRRPGSRRRPTGSGGAAPGGARPAPRRSFALARGEPTTVAGEIAGRVTPAAPAARSSSSATAARALGREHRRRAPAPAAATARPSADARRSTACATAARRSRRSARVTSV